MRRSFSMLSALTACLAAVAGTPPSAQAADGGITVTVVRDNDADGSYNKDREPGQPGITVKVYDAAGKATEAVTDAEGRATFAGGSGRYRVEATIPDGMRYLKPAPAYGPAPSLSPMTTFVDGGAEIVIGVHNPADYVQAEPLLAAPMNRGVNNDAQKEPDPALSALVSWPYQRGGNADSPRPDTRAIQGEIGTTYGLAWQRATRYMFVGALAKRHTLYGPLGSGGIYLTDESGKSHEFATLEGSGSTKHSVNGLLHDSAFYDVPGKEGLGDLDLSEDEKTLYAVNLGTRSLVTFDVSKVTPGTKQEPTSSVKIPDPGCAGTGNWRPWAIGVQDGKVYVGGVCSAQSTQKASDLAVHVLTFNQSAGTFRKAFSHTLDYVRGWAWNTPQTRATWRPWQTRWDPKVWGNGADVRPAYAQPILSDIEFDRGSLLLGFRDRFGDQLGSYAFGVDPNDKQLREPTAASGDIKRACKSGAGWVFEGEGDCPNNYNGSDGGKQPEGTIEFYTGDNMGDGHHEIAAGGLVNGPRFGEAVSTFVDPWVGEVLANGVRPLDNTTGKIARDPYTVASWAKDRTLFGKSNGLGDLELLADPAPQQVGDRVWLDEDGDGTQDGAEPGISGVEVSLTCKEGTSKITTTGADGTYVFNDVPASTSCTIAFDASGATENNLKPTKQGKGGTIDSDADPATGQVTFTTGEPGTSDHNIDAGFTPGTGPDPQPDPDPEPDPDPQPDPDPLPYPEPSVGPGEDEYGDNQPPSAPQPGRAVVSGTVGVAISGQLVSTDPEKGKVTFTVSGGKLPDGVVIGADGKISGTPKAAGDHEVEIKACDAKGACSKATVTFVICRPGVIKPEPKPEPDPEQTAYRKL